MNRDPVRVRARAQIDHRLNFIAAQVFSSGPPEAYVQTRAIRAQRCRDAVPRSDRSSRRFSRARLSSKSAPVSGINLQTLHEGTLPVPRKLQYRSFALSRIFGDLFE